MLLQAKCPFPEMLRKQAFSDFRVLLDFGIFAWILPVEHP
jgi:hypothetical protein